MLRSFSTLTILLPIADCVPSPARFVKLALSWVDCLFQFGTRCREFVTSLLVGRADPCLLSRHVPNGPTLRRGDADRFVSLGCGNAEASRHHHRKVDGSAVAH